MATWLRKLVDWNVHEGRFAKCYCPKCKASSSPWRCLLEGLEPKIAAAKDKVGERAAVRACALALVALVRNARLHARRAQRTSVSCIAACVCARATHAS